MNIRVIRTAAYQTGYMDALTDILNTLNEGGEDAAREWIHDTYEETKAGRP